MELVGTRLGDSIDGTTCETTLANIKRRNANLDLFDGFHRYRLSTSLTTIATIRCQAENVVVGCTINHEVVVSIVGSSK